MLGAPRMFQAQRCRVNKRVSERVRSATSADFGVKTWRWIEGMLPRLREARTPPILSDGFG